mgnify:FL=1
MQLITKFLIITIINSLSLLVGLNVSAVNLSINIEKWGKKPPSYYRALLESREKNIKQDLLKVKKSFKSSNFNFKPVKFIVDKKYQEKQGFILSYYLNEHKMPKVRAEEAAKKMISLLDQKNSSKVSKWVSSYYKGYYLPIANYNSNGKYCRLFAEAIMKYYKYDVYEKTMCRNSDGLWVDINHKTIIKDKYKKETLF